MDLTGKRAKNKNMISSRWRLKLHEIIFEADTPAGKIFDIILLLAIGTSVLTVMLESVRSIEKSYGFYLTSLEWGLTILFTLEYVLRIISVGRSIKYIFSFLGIIDVLSILPTYLSLFVAGYHYFVVIRAIRLLRVFRILKLSPLLGSAQTITDALKASRNKITVFLIGVVTIIIIMGTMMYLIEGEDNGFTSIPKSIYWAIVTLTTVGYGDLSPKTVIGQALASCIMIIGYSIIAVPTGIVTAELTTASKNQNVSTQTCTNCYAEGHDFDAKFCKFCGTKL